MDRIRCSPAPVVPGKVEPQANNLRIPSRSCSLGTSGFFENNIVRMKEVLSHFSAGAFKKSHPAVKIEPDDFCVDESPPVRDAAKDSWQFRAADRGDFVLSESFSDPRSPRFAVSGQIVTANGFTPSKSVNGKNECADWRGCSLSAGHRDEKPCLSSV